MSNNIRFLRFFFLNLFFSYSLLFSQLIDKESEIPDWMHYQIMNDLKGLKKKPLSLKKMNDFFNNYPHYLLIKFTIQNNEVFLEKNCSIPDDDVKIVAMNKALQQLCQTASLPNTTFLFTLHDALSKVTELEVPIFVMSSIKDHEGLILTPDFEVLNERFQVLKGIDLTQHTLLWETKHSQLIWRGSTAQHGMKDPYETMREDNFHLYSRVRLCELSSIYPNLINAKFTLYGQGGQNIPYLQNFRGDFLSFEDQAKYKYHLLIDGNTTAYTNSGWKLFINSLLFKEESIHVQWYYDALIPYVHYIPIKLNLEDLPEKIIWAQEHDEIAKEIAWNALQFARTHLTLKDNLNYLHHLIHEYSKLEFVD